MQNSLTADTSESLYINIKKSYFFGKMKYLPKKSQHMDCFIMFHDGMILIPTTEIEDVTSHYTMSALQLDALFVFCACVHYHDLTNQILIKHSIKKHLEIFKDIPPQVLMIVSSDLFINRLTMMISDELFDDTNNQFIHRLTKNITSIIFITNLTDVNSLKTQLGGKIINAIESGSNIYETITALEKYLLYNTTTVKKYFELVYHDITQENNKFISTVKNILPLCSKLDLSIDETKELEQFVELNKSLEECNNSVLEDFYDYMDDMTDSKWLDNYHYDAGSYRPNDFQTNGSIFYNNYSSYMNDPKELANKNLEKISMKVGGCTIDKCTRNVLYCFIEHGFFQTEKDACDLLLTIFSTERDTLGYVNKYDTLSLYDYYTMVAMANDIYLTYEMFMNKLFTYRYLPIDYLPEIIMRVLGRYLNVVVQLYTYNLTPTVIDNAFDNSQTQYMTIYQYSPDIYYNLIPISQENFTPIGKLVIPEELMQLNILISPDEYSNDTTDIVTV